MKILIVAATWMEVKLLTEELEFNEEKSHCIKNYRSADHEIDILISGIGPVFTTYQLTSVLHDVKYDLVINTGIAGSLTQEIGIGEVVQVVSEEFADLGIEKNEDYLTLFESGFIDSNEYPFEQGLLRFSNVPVNLQMKKVRGITSGKSHGRLSTIAEIKEKFHAQVESMEGAAVFYVCKWHGIECLQIRAVSNFVEPRDSSLWNIPIALENLKHALLEVLTKLTVPVN